MSRPWGGDLRLPDAAKLQAAAREALLAEGRAILADSDRHVPVDTGDLKASGFVDAVPGSARVAVGYTDPEAPWQHEARWRHDVGSRKFLEHAFNRRRRDISRRLAAAIADALTK